MINKAQAINRLKSLRSSLDDIATKVTVGKNEHERVGKELAERFGIMDPEDAKNRVQGLTDTLLTLTERRDKLTETIKMKLTRYE